MECFLARILWNFSEFSGIGLGRFAPWVLSVMISGKLMSRKYKWVEDSKPELYDMFSEVSPRTGKRRFFRKA